MSESKYSLTGAAEAANNLSSAIKGNVLTWKNKRKITMQLLKKLPGTIMGKENYDTAYDKIRTLVKGNNYSGAKDYVKSQLDKIGSQVVGTGSEGWVKKSREKMK